MPRYRLATVCLCDRIKRIFVIVTVVAVLLFWENGLSREVEVKVRLLIQ